ncbi:MAG: Acetolactate synthase small subunit (EC 2.2.1.6), partial [Olavius algarvensis Gamma 1 endosymbiont]
ETHHFRPAGKRGRRPVPGRGPVLRPRLQHRIPHGGAHGRSLPIPHDPGHGRQRRRGRADQETAQQAHRHHQATRPHRGAPYRARADDGQGPGRTREPGRTQAPDGHLPRQDHQCHRYQLRGRTHRGLPEAGCLYRYRTRRVDYRGRPYRTLRHLPQRPGVDAM